MNKKLFSWDGALPKSNSDILTNFATTANFGKKGGRSHRHRRRGKHKNRGNTHTDIQQNFTSQPDYGGKGGEARRGPKGPNEETVIWEKEVVPPIE